MENVDVLIDKERLLPDGQKLGDYFAFWEEIEVVRSMDAVSTAKFKAPFEPSRKTFRSLFRPFSFKPLKVRHELLPFFTGTLVDVRPSLEPNSRTVDVSGYALPGVLGDCTTPAPSDEKPLEFKNLGLRAICSRLCAPFGLEVEFLDDEGPPFERVRLEIDKKVLDFLADLAKQRDLVLSDTREGKLLCWRPAAIGNPRARLVAGQPPVTSISADFSPQGYYSELTGFAQKKRRKAAAKWTELNPFLTEILRPDSFKLDDTERGDARDATRAKLGRMFANIASFQVDMPGWRDPQGRIWEPNTTVTLLAPECMVYRETELVVREVTLRQSATSETASLNLVLPGAFSGDVPSVLPWDEP
jgi:prophage tail gpP-like protein